MRITALEGRPGRKQVRVCLDSKVEMLVTLEVCIQRGLRVGAELSDPDLAELRDAEARRHCLESALRLLSYRQRSEVELRDRLLRKRVAPEVVEEAMERLRSAGLLDDEAFAESWVESRNRRAPRSRRLMASELRARGVGRTVVQEAAGKIDEREAAYRAAERRAKSMSSLPYVEFRRRVGGLLLRRGFNYELVRDTVATLWREASAKGDPGE